MDPGTSPAPSPKEPLSVHPSRLTEPLATAARVREQSGLRSRHPPASLPLQRLSESSPVCGVGTLPSASLSSDHPGEPDSTTVHHLAGYKTRPPPQHASIVHQTGLMGSSVRLPLPSPAAPHRTPG